MTLSCAFQFGMQPGQRFVKFDPTQTIMDRYLEYPRERNLSYDEMRTFWFGLSDPECPGDRLSKLTLKMMLATMLRPRESCQLDSRLLDRLIGIAVVPVEMVKSRRTQNRIIAQPLNSLALEILSEAFGDDEGRRYPFPDRRRAA